MNGRISITPDQRFAGSQFVSSDNVNPAALHRCAHALHRAGVPLLPRIFSWQQAADKNPLAFSVYSSDLIEPSSITDRPCIGTAP